MFASTMDTTKIQGDSRWGYFLYFYMHIIIKSVLES